MARWLKQSTAFTFRIGPFVDSTDGDTAETGLTISQADIQLSKNGGAFAQTSASPTTTHDADGWYQCPLTATDTNTLGPLTVKITESGALKVWEHFMVVPAAVYDTLVAGIIPMQGNSTYGTMQSGSTSSTAVLASATSFVDDLVIGSTLVITGGTGAGQSRVIHDWVSSTDTASISPNWTTTPDNTSTYVVVPTPPAPTNSAALPTALVSSGTGTGQISVTSGIVASSLNAAGLASDAGTEIGTAVWATAARTLTALDEDNTTLDIDAAVRAAIGLATANIDTQLANLPTLLQLNTTRYLKNTASQKVYFTLVDSTDHVTRKTGITVTAQRSLDGAAFGSATGSVTEVGSGVYYLSTTTADINADDVVFRFTGTACDPVELHVVTAS